MKVVLCKGQFFGPISGADETLVTYATHLRAAGHCPSVLLMYPHAADDPYYQRLKAAGAPVNTIAPAGVQTSLRAGRKLAARLLDAFPPSQRLIRRKVQKLSTRIAESYYGKCRDYFARSRADLVHVVTPDPSAAVMIKAAREAGLPVLYQELGIPYHPPAFAAYYEQFVAALPLCSEVAALSPALSRRCLEELPRAIPITVLPVMGEDLLQGHAPRLPARRGGTFGFAARLEHLKGPLVLVEAFAAVGRRFEDSLLKVAGAGSQRQRAVRLAEAAGVSRRCEFLEPYSGVVEKSDFMRSLDVFVLPSLTEGTPNSIVEAMSCGLPVIASAVGGVTDMVTPETGMLVPPGEPAALADAMSRLAADSGLRERMGRAARRRYEEVFSPGAVSPLMLNTYRRVAQSRREKDLSAEPDLGGHRHPWLSHAVAPIRNGPADLRPRAGASPAEPT
ncbi:MAG TPA: glycosyltransferase [Pyrinomonadaceae bacterium]|jgi:glycosyltransferase involved in cell wall biosynthesis